MKNKTDKWTAPVSEVFFSYQGEGPFFGEPQIFVRFFGCNISCDYCDTNPLTYSKYTVNKLLSEIKRLRSINSDTFTENEPAVVLTGGEPLLRQDFLAELLPKLRKLSFKITLETNGILHCELKSVLKYVDVVSMDIKLPSDCGGVFFKEHARFLKLCRTKAYVKIVVTKNTREDEFLRACGLISSVSKKIPLVLQVVSPKKKSQKPTAELVKKMICLAGKKLERIYLIPQMHKIWNVK